MRGGYMVCDLESEHCSCPFAWWTEKSSQAQNYGCLPTPLEIVTMRVKYGKTWACHDDPTTPCIGAIEYLKEKNIPYKVIDTKLITLDDNWEEFVE
jgi:hypothetical protein